jgi:hypothetical protein
MISDTGDEYEDNSGAEDLDASADDDASTDDLDDASVDNSIIHVDRTLGSTAAVLILGYVGSLLHWYCPCGYYSEFYIDVERHYFRKHQRIDFVRYNLTTSNRLCTLTKMERHMATWQHDNGPANVQWADDERMNISSIHCLRECNFHSSMLIYKA